MNALALSHRAPSRALLIIGILLIATTLRAPITGVAPLLGMIRPYFDLGTTAAGALTALPLLAFAVVSPFGALLAREYGLERSLFFALMLVTAGIVLRSRDAAWCLYTGTWIIGMGIAIGNVLLPSLIKRDFPEKVTSITGLYALAMGMAAALASAVAIPLEHFWGWRHSLGTIVALPLAALAVWVMQVGAHTKPARDTAAPPHGGKVWSSALAWQVTLFLGLNSAIYYVAIAWLPTILQDAGLSAAHAGSLHGLLQFATAIPGLLLGPILARMKDQRAAAITVSSISAAALAGLLVAPEWAPLWTVAFGIGSGAAIILGLAFISLRTRNAHQAAALSGMSQCIGYLLAAIGPLAMGAIHDQLHGWAVPLGVTVALALAAAAIGALAGRRRQI